MNAISGDGDHGDGDSVFPSFSRRLADFAAEFDRRFEEHLTPNGDVPPRLLEAVRYSALAPGKRLRPYLVVRCCELVGGMAAQAWPVASAVECIHTFSLIHDDLPAMDDDDLRRGQPTCHKQFGDATAVLAGDALMALAFELLASHVDDGRLASGVIRELARATGWAGMIGGQSADLIGETEPPNLDLAGYIHERKTAALFEASCRLGAMVGKANQAEADSLARFGQMLGRAFQIADDLLDVTATPEVIGKRAKKDAGSGKQTFPRCVGIEGSRLAARQAVDAAVAHLEGFAERADDLRALAGYVVDRNY